MDTHAHVFSHKLKFIDSARYTPEYTVTAEDYLRELDRYGFTHGVLIQPSFLGEDNRYMLDAIAAHPERLKGVAVIDKQTELHTLQAMNEQGIVGIRLNLIGKPCPDLTEAGWQACLERMEQMHWQIELHATPDYLIQLLPILGRYDIDVVIDHFGRFDPIKGVNSPDYQQLLEMLSPAQHWVKVSAYYRLGARSGIQNAKEALALLLERGMKTQLIWGSDWPHTQHDGMSFETALNTFKEIVADDELVKQILTDNNARLFGFKTPVRL
nr:amidohydrolase family protein [Psychrobacter aestuarii]